MSVQNSAALRVEGVLNLVRPNKYWEIEEWVTELLSRRISQHSSTEPVATSISPDRVV